MGNNAINLFNAVAQLLEFAQGLRVVDALFSIDDTDDQKVVKFKTFLDFVMNDALRLVARQHIFWVGIYHDTR